MLMANGVLQDTETECAESMSLEEEMKQWQKVEKQDAKRRKLRRI